MTKLVEKILKWDDQFNSRRTNCQLASVECVCYAGCIMIDETQQTIY